mmetsp:Transcript_81518/g.189338  ORF Transcript_81518/g.189338 Transcript_81518/m.189338 type:complete len:269 (+) Transcript_81518:97-903(+)
MARAVVDLSAALAVTLFALLTGPCLGAETQLLQFTIENGKVQAIAPQEAKPAPPTSRIGSPVLELSPVIFGGNVLREEAGTGHPEQWLVHFCPSWWEQCQAMLKAYAKEADHWQRSLGGGLMGPKVRFAMVDCASHKVLCNEQLVEEYPTIVHYQRGVQSSRWTASGKNDGRRLRAWLTAQLEPAHAQPQQRSLRDMLREGLARDLLLVALGLVGNCYVFASTMSCGPEPAGKVVAGNGDAKGARPGRSAGIARFLPEDWECGRNVEL